MAEVISTGLSTAGVRSEFFNRFGAVTPLYPRLCTRIKSTKDAESYKWLGTIPQMREWGNGRLAKGLRDESYDVANLKYEVTIGVDRDELADDQTGQIMIRIAEMARRAATHKDYLAGLLLINGATSGYNSYDGVTYFNAAHISGASGSQDNDLAATAAAATKTTAECKAALQAAIACMLAFKDDQGEPMHVDMSGMVVLVPPAMYFPMREAAEAPLIVSTSNVLAGLTDVIPFPHLALGTTFYLCKVDGIVKPLVFQDREPLEFGALVGDSDEGWRTEKYQYGVRARYALTYGYWQYCVRTVFNN